MALPFLMRAIVRAALLVWGLLVVAAPAMGQEAPPMTDQISQPAMVTDQAGGIHVTWIEGEVGGYTIY